jgi:hypothetical protein
MFVQVLLPHLYLMGKVAQMLLGIVKVAVDDSVPGIASELPY